MQDCIRPSALVKKLSQPLGHVYSFTAFLFVYILSLDCKGGCCNKQVKNISLRYIWGTVCGNTFLNLGQLPLILGKLGVGNLNDCKKNTGGSSLNRQCFFCYSVSSSCSIRMNA